MVGDLDDDGSVSTSDLLEFLILFGSIYEGSNGAFQPARVFFDRNVALNRMLDFYNNNTSLFMGITESTDVGTVTPSGVSINIYDSTESPADVVEFISGSNAQFPITAWTQKKVQIARNNSGNFVDYNSAASGLTGEVFVQIQTFNSSGTLIGTHLEVIGDFYMYSASTGTRNFSSVCGADTYTTNFSMTSNQITKIQVKMGIQPQTADDAYFAAMLSDYKIQLISATN